MQRNDPSTTGGMFIGRRPGTAPPSYPDLPEPSTGPRRVFDQILAACIAVVEVSLCLSLWVPQPLFWLWVGSQINYYSASVTFGITAAFAGMLFTLFVTLALLKRVDHAWKLVRRAAGVRQTQGLLERIFVITAGIASVLLAFWILIYTGFPK